MAAHCNRNLFPRCFVLATLPKKKLAGGKILLGSRDKMKFPRLARVLQ
jgi:hypothetical protein